MPEQFPKISIVTASFNQGAFIEDCILSVIEQQYPNLEYIILDGGSTDNTTDIIKKYEAHISFWVSEKDKGLYDALNRGLDRSTGDIMGWLNSDDLLMPGSLFTLAEIFSGNPDVEWLQGHPCVADERGRLVYQRPPRYSKYAFYNKEYRDGIFIQQESTYWKRSLWEKAGSFVSTEYKYAGDFELWMRFYGHADLFNTSALIGAFRTREGQLSSKNYKEYLLECDSIVDDCIKRLRPEELQLLERLNKDKSPSLSSRLLSKLGLSEERLREDALTRRFINYDLQKKCFIREA